MKQGKIAALGPKGTYGHQAAVIARKVLQGRGVETEEDFLFRSRNEDILSTVAIMGDEGCFGVAPIENARGLLVSEVAGHWLLESRLAHRSPLVVIGEIHLPIQHCLLAHPSVTDVTEIERVMSHPQALLQCAGRLNALGLSPVFQVPEKSTAEAAEKVANDPLMRSTAAIASSFAAEFYGLKILERGLEQQFGNETRFHILGVEPVGPTGNDRTAVMFELPNKPSAIFNVLAPIAQENVNMTALISISLGEMNKYAFYVEMDCHMETEEGQRIKAQIEAHTITSIFLGSYPREKREV